MNILWTKIGLVVFSLFLSLPIPSGSVTGDVGIPDTTITIGTINDTTGPIAGFGIPRVESMKAIIHHYNDQGGINGRKILYVNESDDYKAARAASAFKKMVEIDKIFCLSGTLGAKP